jgi:hypothetical protein
VCAAIVKVADRIEDREARRAFLEAPERARLLALEAGAGC